MNNQKHSVLSGTRTWLDAANEFGQKTGIDSKYLKILEAFRSENPRSSGSLPEPEERFAGSFLEFERDIIQRIAFPKFAEKLAQQLADEVDRAQADMFARRITALDELITRFGCARGRLLRVGLLKRLNCIINAPPPRALRVRALVDYYYSHAARLHHSQHSRGGQPLTKLVTELRWKQIVPGLVHARLNALEENGPIHANFLKVDPTLIKIQVANCRDKQVGNLSERCIQEGAIAAVSGGYFLYSESDIELPSQRYDPVGLLVSKGMVHNPPVFRRSSLLIGSCGSIALKLLGLQGLEMLIDNKIFKVSEAWNRTRGFWGPQQSSISVVGNVITSVGIGLKIPLNGFVLPLPDTLGLKPGDPVQYQPPRMNTTEPVVEGIAGGPMIVSEGQPILNMRAEDFWGITPPVTFSQDETGDQNRLARLAIGLDSENHLLFAAVDGRNFEFAIGMTLGELANLMITCGCHTAINLDGGSSKRMLVNGEVVDLPSTELVSKADDKQRIRPVQTAILLSSK